MAMADSNHLSALINSLSNDTIHSHKRISPRTKMSSIVSKYLTDYEIGEDLPEDYVDWQPRKDPKGNRKAGILLHPALLPGSNVIGELGQKAFCFLDWLQNTGCVVWQVTSLHFLSIYIFNVKNCSI